MPGGGLGAQPLLTVTSFRLEIWISNKWNGGCFKGDSKKFKGYVKKFSNVFHKHFKGVTRKS